MKLRIVYIGAFNGKGDEGLTQLSKSTYSHFACKHHVRCLNSSDFLRLSSLIPILTFRPHIIHYLTGPTFRSLLIGRLSKLLCLDRPKTVFSCTRPFLGRYGKPFIKYFRPDLVLSQAHKWDKVFVENEIPTVFVPNPVNLKTFRLLSTSKVALRMKYGLPVDKMLLLHVGHIRQNRNLDFLIDIQDVLSQNNATAVVVSSTFFDKDSVVYDSLKGGNFIIIDRFLENIEELYNACDYYLFPCDNLSSNCYPTEYNQVGAVDMPLSILEAWGCGLPVLSTPIDAIERLIEDITDPPIVFFLRNCKSFTAALHAIQKRAFDFRPVQQKIEREGVFRKIEEHYRRLCQ